MKYGPEKTEEICERLRNGSNRTDACLLSDISYQTFSRWMDDNEFSEAIKKAEAVFKNKNIIIIQTAAQKTWQAAAWLLERKYRGEYALQREEYINPDATHRLAGKAIELLKEFENRAKSPEKVLG